MLPIGEPTTVMEDSSSDEDDGFPRAHRDEPPRRDATHGVDNEEQGSAPDIAFLEGSRSPVQLSLEGAPASIRRRGLIYAGDAGDTQTRVVRHSSRGGDQIRLEVQSISKFSPLLFFVHLVYVYAIFQLSVYLIIMTISFAHQVSAGTLYGDAKDICKIPLMLHFVHVVSHLLCVINRIFFDIFSNFEYIQYRLVPEANRKARQLVELAFALVLIAIPVAMIFGAVATGQTWSEAFALAQRFSLWSVGGIVVIYVVEHFVTVWFIIRKLRPHTAGRAPSCKRGWRALGEIVWKRIEFSLSSIKTSYRSEGSDIEQSMSMDAARFPSIIRFLYEAKLVRITTLTELTYSDLVQDVGHAGARRFDKLSCGIVFIAGLFVLSGITACVLIVVFVFLTNPFGRGVGILLALITVVSKASSNVQSCCQKCSSDDLSSIANHIIWIISSVDPPTVARLCGVPRVLLCESHRPLAESVERIWVAKPRKLWSMTVFAIIMCISLGMTIGLLVHTSGDDYQSEWFAFTIMVSVLSFAFFVLDPEGWVYLSSDGDLARALLQPETPAAAVAPRAASNGTEAPEVPGGPARPLGLLRSKDRHRLEALRWIRKQRLLYFLMGFVIFIYFYGLFWVSEELQDKEVEYTNLRVQSLEVEGGQDLLGYCNVQAVWNASEDIGLSLVDFGVLAALAYEPQNDDTKEVMRAWFNGTAASVQDWEEGVPASCGAPGATTRIFEVTPSAGGSTNTVLSVRGTFDFFDMLEDISLWGPVVLMDAAAQILPFGETWESSVPSLLQATKLLNAGRFADSLVECVRELKEHAQAQGGKLYLTGHSLGGGIASILGARQDVPNAVFSAPGTELSINLLAEGKADELQRNTVNVIPDGDMVPRVDRSAFHTQRIECDDNSLMRPIGCHGIVRTVNTLASMCHAPRRLLKEDEVA